MHYPSFCKLPAEYGQDERVSSFISFRNWMHEYQCRTFVDLCLDCWNLIIYIFTTDLLSLQLFIGWQIFWKIFKGERKWVFATNSDFRTPISFATLCRRPLIFQTLNYVRANSQSLKYQRFTPSYSTDIGVRKFEFVAKTHFLFMKCNRRFLPISRQNWIECFYGIEQ